MKNKYYLKLLYFLVLVLSLNMVYAQTYDVIGNGEEWFVCNADGNAPVFGDLPAGNYLGEYQTFTEKNVGGLLSCRDTLEEIFGRDFDLCDPTVAGDCDGKLDYCYATGGGDGPLYSPGDFLNDCKDDCFINSQAIDSDDSLDEICSAWPTGLIECDIPDIPTATPGSNIVPKDLCGLTLTGCIGESSLESCQEIAGRNPCNDDEVCRGGSFVYSNEDPGGVQFNCCTGAGASCETFDPSDCAAFGGIPRANPQDICTGREIAECCFQGEWYADPTGTLLGQVYPPERFICYKEKDENRFAECCPGYSNCKNRNNPSNTAFEKKYLGLGGTFHTLNNYDGYDTYDNLIDRVQTYTDQQSDEREISHRLTDWRGYDFLEFDIGYANMNVDQIIITDAGANQKSVQLVDHLTNGRGTFRWHHVVIPINNDGLDYSDIVSLKLTYSAQPYPDIVLDNIRLVDDGSENSETYFCSGDWGLWVGNLDGFSDDGFDDDATLVDKSPNKVACNAQAAFGWTGSRCCGDDTRFNHGEFFNDTRNGCFNGTTVLNDWTLAKVSNDVSDNKESLLFFGGEFLVCGDVAFDEFSGIMVSFDGETESATSLITSSQKVGFFATKGSWYCDVDKWKLISDANRMRVIASTLKAMGEQEGDYILHCGNGTTVMNSVTELGGDDTYGKKDYCVLNVNGKITIGTTVDDVDAFLNDYIKMIYHPFTADAGQTYMCRDPSVPFEAFTNDKFYQQCTDASRWLNASYNEPIGILLFSLKESELADGFFGFFINMWTAIVDFFRELFEGPEQLASIPLRVSYEEANFDELYIANSGEQRIRGLREGDGIVVVYTDFESDITFLKDLSEQWLEDMDDEFFIAIDGSPGIPGNQTISINGTPDNFPWTYLTSNLKFS